MSALYMYLTAALGSFLNLRIYIIKHPIGKEPETPLASIATWYQWPVLKDCERWKGLTDDAIAEGLIKIGHRELGAVGLELAVLDLVGPFRGLPAEEFGVIEERRLGVVVGIPDMVGKLQHADTFLRLFRLGGAGSEEYVVVAFFA